MTIHNFVVQSKLADSFDAIVMWWELDMDGTGFIITVIMIIIMCNAYLRIICFY